MLLYLALVIPSPDRLNQSGFSYYHVSTIQVYHAGMSNVITTQEITET